MTQRFESRTSNHIALSLAYQAMRFKQPREGSQNSDDISSTLASSPEGKLINSVNGTSLLDLDKQSPNFEQLRYEEIFPLLVSLGIVVSAHMREPALKKNLSGDILLETKLLVLILKWIDSDPDRDQPFYDNEPRIDLTLEGTYHHPPESALDMCLQLLALSTSSDLQIFGRKKNEISDTLEEIHQSAISRIEYY